MAKAQNIETLTHNEGLSLIKQYSKFLSSEVVKRTGYTENYVYNVLRGRYSITTKNIEIYKQAKGVLIEYLEKQLEIANSIQIIK